MAGATRLSTAAQFFEDDGAGSEAISTYDRVVDLINKATLMRKEQDKVNNLKLVTELIVHKEPALLDNFLDEMLAFQSDRAPEVKKFIVTFIEEACKKDPDVFSKVIGNLVMLLQDDNVAVSKKVMISMSNLYRVAFQWIAKAKSVTDGMEQTWHCIIDMKNKIIEMLDSDNDGVRTHAVKFMEGMVLCLSEKQPESEAPKGKALDISLDIVPSEHTFFKYKKMEDEGKKTFERLTDFIAWNHISSVNLMTCMSVLTNAAKQRPQYMSRVIQAFEALHVNLPPTLAKSQVSSVRKNLKMQLLQLLKHPASYDNQSQVTTLLTDLGATQSEVLKNMPKIDESKKRKTMEEQSEPTTSTSSKKAKVEIPLERDDDDDGATPFIGLGAPQPKKKTVSAEVQKSSAIDITAEDLISRLTPQNVADLVLLSMVMLPDTMPPTFSATYTPIAAAGTDAQIQHLSRLLATQLTAAGLGKGVHEMQGKTKVEPDDDEETEEPVVSKQTSSISTVVGGKSKDEELPKPVLPPPPKFTPPAKPPSRKGLKQFKLAAVTKPLDTSQVEKMALEAIKRILKAEKAAQLGNVKEVRTKILASLVCQFGGPLRQIVQKYIFEDLRNRADLALAWVYHEYSTFQGYTSTNAQHEKPSVTEYDECLTGLLTGLLERPDQREGLFSRLLLEAPYITPNSIQVLRKYCQDETRIYLGMTTLKELIVKRPCLKLEVLDVLLDFTSHEKPEVRNNAIRVTKTLHEVPDLTKPIERYALFYLKYLLLPTPPAELFEAGKGHGEAQENWTDDTIKMCLYLYLGLLPVNHGLIHELANVYTTAIADVKRSILRVLEAPVKGMGMHSPELLLLVENCPKGAETLVTRIIHILTDKNAPSPDLVKRVRDLYQKRVSDVRFLIPVLTGLSKPEVIAALPKLIKLNPVVVKEVFNRLLGISATQQGHVSPLTPAELLVALHNIDTTKVDMKTIIKATNLCFGEKTIYTLEILAAVMNQLVEQTPLPTLLMRTVIQSIAMYPKLLGYAMNIMQRLINKQVWKQKKVWEGFVKCCQRCKPQSFQVLLQLPAQQLKSAFEICPDLREPLLQHVQGLTPHQRAHIQKSIIMVLEKGPDEDKTVQEASQKPQADESEKLKAQEAAYQEKLEHERGLQQAETEEFQTPGLDPAVKVKEEPMDTDEVPVTLVNVKVEEEVVNVKVEKEIKQEEEPMETKPTTPRRSARNTKS